MAKTKSKSSRRASFGAVSRVNTAPVAIGNSIRGSVPKVTQKRSGARIVGRELGLALYNTTASITGWECIGGLPITPCALPSSILRNYCQMYSNFKVNSIAAHYVTSASTTQTGDIMFYYEPHRVNPFPDYTSSSFLPFVLSDPNTVIGPQWTNHTAIINPVRDWKSTTYGNSTDPDEEVAGTLFVFSKTSAANSPGYVMLDYDLSFKNLATNPRAGTLPVARAQYTPVCFKMNGTSTSGNSATFDLTTGKTITGSTSTEPSGATSGDVYKVVLQINNAQNAGNAAWSATTTTPTASNMLRWADDTVISLDDGATFYALKNGSTWRLYSTVDQARLAASPLEYVNTDTSVVFTIPALVSLVCSVDALQQSSY
nr:MAG: hypothetical protein 3 [Luteoviridae sp.]